MTFDRDFGVLLSLKDRTALALPVSGNVLRNGVYEPVIAGRIETDYDAAWYPRGLTVQVTTAQRTYTLTGKVLSTVPLRHKRVGSTDSGSCTRITESMTESTCEGRTVLGMTEYCDVMEGGVPLSALSERPAVR